MSSARSASSTQPSPQTPDAPSGGARREIDLSRVKPYADQLGDGLVQLSFTLPVPYGLAARRAAQELATKMGLEHPEVVHYQRLTDGYTYFTMFGQRAGEPATLVLDLLQLDRPHSRQRGLDESHLTPHSR